jgi:glycosyltransferase involved in cell wall biosynthesis
MIDCECKSVQFRYLRLPFHCGAPVARNKGAALASGDVLMFLDDDDTWETTKIELQLMLFEAHPEVGTIYTGMLAIDYAANGKTLSASHNHHSGEGWPSILFRNFIGPTSAVALRTKLFHELGGFDTSLKALQDYDLWLRLCLHGPILYDGAHNLRFSAVSNSVDRISTNVANYEAAFQHLLTKYQSETATLGPLQRRRFLAQTKLLLSAKHWQQKNRTRAAMLMLRAITLYPPTIGRLMMSMGNNFLWRCCGTQQH